MCDVYNCSKLVIVFLLVFIVQLHPELNTQDVTLEDVIARVQMTKRAKPIGIDLRFA